MIRSILVPLDGSPFAERALPLAQELAHHAGATLRLLAVHEPPPDLQYGMEMLVPPAEHLEARAATEAYLQVTAARIGEEGEGPVFHEVVDGAAGPAVANAVMRQQPDLVVMSTHGRGPMSRFWLGSVADHLIRHVTTPVLLVRPHEEEPPAAPLIHRILVATDLSAESLAVLPIAAAVAGALGARLTLFHVVEPIVGMVDGALPFPMPVDSGQLERRRAMDEERLREIAAGARGEGPEIESKVVVGVGAAPTVLEEVTQGGYDLVAMATHGAGGVRRLLLGSVADKVIRASDTPVLVLRSPEAAAPASA